jgi:nucleotide-binding universal stress UspA family protein
MMFKNVLVGVDGGPGGRDAIAFGTRLITPDGTLTFAHAHSGQLHPLHAITPGFLTEEREASQKLLSDARNAADVDARLVSIVALSPAGGLHEQAEDQGADLLVVGSCSRGIIGRAMVGDDTRAALNGAPCAVAIASRGYAEHPTPVTKIGVAYDGSPESAAALSAARELAAANGATLHALEVVSIPTVAYTGIIPPAIGESVDVMLQAATDRMKKLAGVEGRAVYGLPGEELAAFSQTVDILIAGSRGYGPFKRLLFGSTSDYLARHVRCPLLVLPRSAAKPLDESRDPNEVDIQSGAPV